MLYKKSYAELRAGYEAGDFKVVDVAKEMLERAQSDKLNIFLGLYADKMLESAEESDRRFANKTARPLEGFPLTIKDNFCVRGTRTTAASKILENFTPDYESTVTQRLWDAGAFLVGKANLDEFAMGSSNEKSAFGCVKNPWDETRVPGGSSGGSAAAVAGGLSVGALGTDTGGSVRQPASFCGVVGMRPTYGLCSRYGIIAFASSLDQPGPITRNVEDNARLLEVMAGHDRKDMTSMPVPKQEYSRFLKDSGGIAGKTFGITTNAMQWTDKSVAQSFNEAVQLIKDLGGKCVEIESPYMDVGVMTYLLIAASEASSNLACYDGVRYTQRAEPCSDMEALYNNTRGALFGAEVRRRILIGVSALSSGNYQEYYAHVLKVRRKICNDYAEQFKSVDFMISPTSPILPFLFGAVSSPEEMYAQDIMTVLAAISGVPAISIPCGVAQGLPVGLQLTAPMMEERGLYKAAHELEKSLQFVQLIKR